jgi:hemolysin III
LLRKDRGAFVPDESQNRRLSKAVQTHRHVDQRSAQGSTTNFQSLKSNRIFRAGHFFSGDEDRSDSTDDGPMMRDQQESSGLAPVPDLHAGEFVNALTHGLGLVLSIVGGIVLLVCALTQGDAWRVAGCSVFATTLIAVYAFSTLSHSSLGPELTRLFERLDQGFIYLLIAGSYTPFSLAYLRTGWWWLLFAVMWTGALCGCFSKIFFFYRFKAVAVWTYVLLGWIPIIATSSLIQLVPAAGLWWMLIGGLCYTVGTVFLICDHKRFHFHAIWHMFVIAGSTCHFFAILFFVAYSTASPL